MHHAGAGALLPASRGVCICAGAGTVGLQAHDALWHCTPQVEKYFGQLLPESYWVGVSRASIGTDYTMTDGSNIPQVPLAACTVLCALVAASPRPLHMPIVYPCSMPRSCCSCLPDCLPPCLPLSLRLPTMYYSNLNIMYNL